MTLMTIRQTLIAACLGLATPALAQVDGATGDLIARIQRLEGQNRTLTGEVEQLTNLLKRNQDEFKRYREDTEFRLQALEGAGEKPSAGQPPRSSAQPAGPKPPASATAAQGSPAPSPKPPAASGAPAGPGAPPRTLDELAAEAAGDTAMDLEPEDGVPSGEGEIAGPPGNIPPPPRSSLVPPGLPGVAVPSPGTEAATAPAASDQDPAMASLRMTAEEEYTANYRLIEAKNYEAAEMAFRNFIAAHPKDRRVADATHWIGESFFQRQQFRDAAEQFLKVTKDHQDSRRAPSSMLRLGTSLAALGEKDAACATFQEIDRRYPGAGQTVKTGVEKELKRNGC